jgi:hypothetical protein
MRNMSRHHLLTAGLLVALSGCASDGLTLPSNEHDVRFVGLWGVDQPNHALYEITLYTLRADGVIDVGPTRTFDGASEDFVTGTVARADGSVICELAGTWHSLDSANLLLETSCSDGLSRDLHLRFAASSAGNTVDAQVIIVSVGGEGGWVHPGPDWRFFRCGSEAACLDF